jgi:predicted RNA-binding Zn-ribbon protein involved in translation (DUF1610 family)
VGTSLRHWAWLRRAPQTVDRVQCIACGIQMTRHAAEHPFCPYCGADGFDRTFEPKPLTSKEMRRLMG